MPPIRTFESGATRNTDEDKLDFEGFLSPLALRAFAEYMHENRTQSDGALRDSDNWQKGITLASYMKSGWRHFFDWWGEHRGYSSREGIKKALCGLIFNAMGYLHELEKNNPPPNDSAIRLYHELMDGENPQPEFDPSLEEVA